MQRWKTAENRERQRMRQNGNAQTSFEEAGRTVDSLKGGGSRAGRGSIEGEVREWPEQQRHCAMR